MKNVQAIWDHVDTHMDDFTGLADRVFDTPETLYAEHRSVEEHRKMLEAKGFRITTHAAGLPTAVVGEAGEDGPVIAILGEFDALPMLSQEPGVATRKPLEDGANGHGCGHNLLGSAALLAATAVKDWLEETGIKARVRYYGCPAEEGGAAKTFMVREGLFDDVDAAISWHPSSITCVNPADSLANARIDFTFTGTASHAAASPELGRSALDAAEIMNIGINYMREHMPDSSRVHYAYIDAGGAAPNVVQAKTTLRQLVRAANLPELRDMIARVHKIAEGAALITETQVAHKVFSSVSNLLGNRPLEEAMQTELDKLGPVDFDEADRAFAREVQQTLSDKDIKTTFTSIGMKPRKDLPLCDFVLPLDYKSEGGNGSTDVGDVSWAVPTVQARVTTMAIGTPLHTWQTVAQGKSPAAHKGMTHAAKVMAATAERLIEDPALLAAAKAAHQEHLEETPYKCPMPDETQPTLVPKPD